MAFRHSVLAFIIFVGGLLFLYAAFYFYHIEDQYFMQSMILLMIGILLSFYFFLHVNRRNFIEKAVRERTNQLETINSILQQEIRKREHIEENITETQEYLQRRLAALDYLTKFTISEPNHAIKEVILRTAHVMRIDRVSAWLYEKEDQKQFLSCVGAYHASTNSFLNHLKLSSDAFPHYFKEIADHSYLIIPSITNAKINQELSSYLATFNITSKLDIPIILEGNLLGILSCEETRGHKEWLLEDRHFGQTIADIIAIMITQSARRKAEIALQESEENLRFITQNAVDGIISINQKQEIVSWNLGAERIFGYNESEIKGKSLHLIVPENIAFLQKEMIAETIELKGQHKDRSFFPIEISHTQWKGGELVSIIIRDITERKEYEQRLLLAVKEAKAANAAKNEFLATISHELRTPLNAIIGFNQCILLGMDGPTTDQQKTSLQKIDKSSFHLLQLINDILDLAKIEAHRVVLEIKRYNIVEIAKTCVDELKPLAEKKKLSFTFTYHQPIILVELDRVRITQVFLNLLSNAIKFTKTGSIQVHLTESPLSIDIEIIDTGIGLTNEEMKKIFIPFSQADSSITRKFGGTGLGLVICKNIVELHDGKIHVESQKGKGSTFSFTLPKIAQKKEWNKK